MEENMAIDRLTGADATLYKYTPKTSAETTGVATKGAFYKIASKATTSSIFGDFAVGQLWMEIGRAHV